MLFTVFCLLPCQKRQSAERKTVVFLMTLTTVTKTTKIATVDRMRKIQRVIVYGNSLALAGIEASLNLDPECEVVGHAWPFDQQELSKSYPDVVIFELDAVPPERLYALSKEIPGLLLIGIDPESNRAQLWSGQQAKGWTSQDLSRVIHRAKFNIPFSGGEGRE